jgi:hypothetical protein
VLVGLLCGLSLGLIRLIGLLQEDVESARSPFGSFLMLALGQDPGEDELFALDLIDRRKLRNDVVDFFGKL